jgi:dTDP-4-dehydrorhamnose 3,5-epimerase
MKFIELKLQGSFTIIPDLIEDERGHFARIFCRREFIEQRLISDFVQCNISFNKKKGTLRGMHYQVQPHAEVKLVRCATGAIYDVIVDLRQGSPTFKQWATVELSAKNHTLLYIPEGFAHGFQTLTDDTELIYHHNTFYSPEHYYGLRFDDPAFMIKWPLPISVLSQKDRLYPPIDNTFKGIEI